MPKKEKKRSGKKSGCKKNSGKNDSIEKSKTGIKGFDELLEGGTPKNRSLMVTGSTGVGKTVLLNEFIYRGIEEFDEPGVFVTFEEKPADIKKNVCGFGWDYDRLEKEGKLAFVDFSPDISMQITQGEDYNLEPLIQRIKHAVKKVKAKRVSIDSLSSLFGRFEDKGVIRNAIYRILDELKKLKVTSMVSAEKVDGENSLSRYGVEEFVADGAVELGMGEEEQSVMRKIIVRKMRGVGYRSGRVNFEIREEGLEVYPKIPIERNVAKTDFKERKKFGLKNLDKIMGGGIPEGHSVLVGGNTGTGKTSLSLQFLVNGIENGEKGVFVALEEPIPQIKKAAKQMGWDLEKYEKQGKLIFVTEPLIDTLPDKLLYSIINAIEKEGAKRLAFDSVSSLLSSTMDRESVRRFLIQLTSYFKKKGVTSVLNYLTSNMFQSPEGQLLGGLQTNEMRLSSVIDGIILLRYVEKDQEVQKLLNVLKMRGSQHSKDIFRYELDEKGFRLGEKFKSKEK